MGGKEEREMAGEDSEEEEGGIGIGKVIIGITGGTSVIGGTEIGAETGGTGIGEIEEVEEEEIGIGEMVTGVVRIGEKKEGGGMLIEAVNGGDHGRDRETEIGEVEEEDGIKMVEEEWDQSPLIGVMMSKGAIPVISTETWQLNLLALTSNICLLVDSVKGMVTATSTTSLVCL